MNNYRFRKLRGKIKEVYNTEVAFADALCITHTSLSNKLTGKSDFKLYELIRAVKLLGIEPNEVYDYFFKTEGDV